MQCACAKLSSVACPALQYFSTLSHKGRDFREVVTEEKVCVLIFSTILSKIFLILRRYERHIVINVHKSSCKYQLLFLSDFNETSIFMTDFRKILKYQISRKSVP